MGRSMPRFSYFSPPYSSEEKMLLQLDLAGKVLYLLTLIVLLLLYLRKWKRNRRGGRRHVQTTNRVNVFRGDNGGETIRGQIARRSRANIAMRVTSEGQYARGFKVVSEDKGEYDGGTINGDVAMRVTSEGQYAGGFEVVGEDEGEYDGGPVNVVRGDNGGETIRGQIARRVRANVAGGEVGDTTGGQYAGEVHFNVAGDDDGGDINGEIEMGPTSLAATMPF